MKVVVVMNPLAGGGRAKALIEGPDACCYTGLLKQQTTCFLDAMKQMNPKCPVKVELTTHAGHAIELAKKYTEEGWTVVGSRSAFLTPALLRVRFRCARRFWR